MCYWQNHGELTASVHHVLMYLNFCQNICEAESVVNVSDRQMRFKSRKALNIFRVRLLISSADV